MIIFTHRGLEPDKKDFFPESSYEAFADQLQRGFGIEFDVCFAKDGIIISHDSNLKRLTSDRINKDILALTVEQIKKIKYGNKIKGRLADFDELMNLIRGSNSKMGALHFKGKYQTLEKTKILIRALKKNEDILNRLIIFDVKPETARVIKKLLPRACLAPSVAHEFDIKRYNHVVGNTLISLERALVLAREGLFGWFWLDEWDTLDREGKKKMYAANNFAKIREAGVKIALVTPELHGTSPGLLGEEAHADSKPEKLFSRIKEIINLKPDAICTDYPEKVKEMS
jgi:hypothetical protein